MAIQPNYLARGGDPYAGAAAVNEDALSTLGMALFGNPQMAGQRALRTAQAEQIGLENERARRGLQYGDSFGADMASAFTVRNPDGSTRPATFAEAAPRLSDLFKSAYWANGGDPGRALPWLRAFTAFTGNEDLTRAGYAATGANLGPDFAATTGRADQVQARNAASDKDRATAVAGIGAQAQRDVAGLNNRGASDRLAAELRWKSENPTYDQARARVLEPWLNDPLLDPGTRAERQETVIAPGVPTARERARGQEAAARERAAGSVQVAQVRAASGERIAQLQADGRVSAADAAGYWRHQAAIEAGNARVDSADAAAAARVQAAIEAGNARVDSADAAAAARVQAAIEAGNARRDVADTQGQTARDVATTNADGRVRAAQVAGDASRDVAATRAGAQRPAIAVPTAVAKGWDTEIDALVGESNFSVNDEAKLWLKQRAGEIYQQPGPAQRNGTAAMRQAWEDFKSANPANTRGLIGRQLFSPRFGAPAAPGGPALVPTPGAPAPAGGGIPPRPPGVPQGSQYSPSRRMWRDPEGRTYTEDGRPAA